MSEYGRHAQRLVNLVATTLLASATIIVLTTLSVSTVEPSVRITEILYDAEGSDAGKEYVEIANVGSQEVDMTTVKFFERSDRPGRKIGQGRGDTTLQPGEVAVIVENPEVFLQNYSFSGAVLDTSGFALLNTGSTVTLQQQEQQLHSVTYTEQDGARGDGKSLHVMKDDTIVAKQPSPGEASEILTKNIQTNTGKITTPESSSAATSKQVRSGSSARSSKKDKSSKEKESEFAENSTTLITNPERVFSASVTKFSVAQSNKKKPPNGSWNFGDGTVAHGSVVEHVYLFPGTYIITFQEGDGGENNKNMTKEWSIRVIFPQVEVERVNRAFVRFHNHHQFTLDVSGWKVVSGNSIFTFPERSRIPQQADIPIVFATGENEQIYVITAGGGQFSGQRREAEAKEETEEEKIMPAESTIVKSTTETKKQETEKIKTETEAEAEANPKSQTALTENDARTNEVSKGEEVGEQESESQTSINTDETGNNVYAIDSKQSRRNIKGILIWVALLILIISIALVPLLSKQHKGKSRKK